jgi:hypothetical protein
MRIGLALVAILGATALTAASAGAARPAYTNAQLAPMVLPESQLGAVARGLDVKIGSGVQGNAAAAEDSLDPEDTAAQLARGGRISGYSLEYDDLAFDRLERRRGVLAVGSSVDLFTTAAAAAAYDAKQRSDGTRYAGKYVEAGFRLAGWHTAPVDGLGKGAVLVRESLQLGDTRYYGTLVLFRRGPLLGSVGITRADGSSASRTAVRLARLLAKRMGRAQHGSLGFQPVFVPRTASKGKAPAGGPDLAAMSLTASELPRGGRLADGGYAASRTVLGMYRRQFDFTGGPTLGGAGLLTVESELNLLRSKAEASGLLVRLRALYASPDVDRAFTDGFNVKGVEVERLRSVAAGDEAAAVVLSFTVNGRTAHIVQVSMRVGRVVGLLNVSVVGPRFRAAAVTPLAAKLGRRIRRGL